MNKKILHFGQHPNHKETYELFVAVSSPMGDLFKLRTDMEKKLFKTEMKDCELLGKFEGEWLVVNNMVRYLDREGWER